MSKVMKKLEEMKARLEEADREGYSLERNLLSISSEQRKRMHKLFAEAKELRIQIYSLEMYGEY